MRVDVILRGGHRHSGWVAQGPSYVKGINILFQSVCWWSSSPLDHHSAPPSIQAERQIAVEIAGTERSLKTAYR